MRKFAQVAAGIALFNFGAQAAVSIQVTTTTDEYGTNLFGCSLREALHAMALQANFGGCGLISGALVNSINLPAGVYPITLPRVLGNPPVGGAFYVSTGVSINGAGPGQTIVDASGIDRGFDVEPAGGSTTTLRGLSIRNGTPSLGDPNSFFGAGIFVVSSGTFNATNVVVTSSGYTNGSSSAVYIQSAAANLLNTTIAANPAIGLQLYQTQASSLQNVTISGNAAQGPVGGIQAKQLSGTLLINNSTIAYNHAANANADPIRAGGIFTQQATVQIANSIVARNSVGDRSSGADCQGFVTSLGYNLIEDTQNCFIGGVTTGNLSGVDPKLAPLFDYGSGALTHLLLPGSAALDAGNPAPPGSGGSACVATDARGVNRTAAIRCDIGPYEYFADFTVNSTLDAADANPGDGLCAAALAGSPCTLRAAIDEANAGSFYRTIRVPAGRYTLAANGTPLTFNSTHAIALIGDGANRTVIDQTAINNPVQVMQRGVSLHAITLTGGTGGMIANAAGFLLDAVRVTQNSGGLPAILLLECCASDLLMVDSTVDHNVANVVFGGGGMYVGSGSSATILNSTFFANATDHDGGGIYNHGGSVSMAFSTIAGNIAHASSPGDVGGGGIARGGSGSYFIASSILTNNIDSSGQGPDCAGAVQITNWTLLRDPTGCAAGGQPAELISGVNPQLSSLALQGGHTPTLGLSAASPAHGVLVNPDQCVDTTGRPVLTDQRGLARPTSGYGAGAASMCDLGAFQGVSDVIFADGFQ